MVRSDAARNGNDLALATARRQCGIKSRNTWAQQDLWDADIPPRPNCVTRLSASSDWAASDAPLANLANCIGMHVMIVREHAAQAGLAL